jgi:uncharacterized protein with FMN-binding domain
MDKSTLLLLSIILAVFGGSVAAGHPAWGTLTGIAIILLAAGLAVGTLPLQSQDYFEERVGPPSKRTSNSLVTLSSAAIVAIYAAGYHRTSSAAHKFDSQTPQQRTSATIAIVTPPAATSPAIDATPPGLRSETAAIKKNAKRPSSPVRKAAPSKSSVSASPSAPSTSPTATYPPANEATQPATAAQARYKDGVYLGWGSCRHGDIEASVVIQEGKIASVAISQCLTRYSCSWIAPKTPGGGFPDLPGQVVERQSPKVDYVSGATESSYAFADAVIAALSKATE